MPDLRDARWRTSTHSGGSGGTCVEVATNLRATTGAVHVRDSKDPHGPILSFIPDQWEAFVQGIRDGAFDQ